MTMDGSRSDKDLVALDEIFYQGVVAPTSRVLTHPSSDLQQRVVTLAQSMNISKVLEQAGVLAAMALADELEAYGIRPADFDHLELAPAFAARIASKIKDSKVFQDAFVEQLSRRG